MWVAMALLGTALVAVGMMIMPWWGMILTFIGGLLIGVVAGKAQQSA